ncbi:glycosyltransferase [Arthrobacter sp. ATA002]|uniref:glycosyltransferase family protein n=1 Tax=Arthrobacter sp. ATA002 TaxID=2991715 RepID=UPI0022A6A676|nr:glycosyltransferase [Arthrobacter sp. ATA002]WAP52907.1 glycosyltransferase [Arthrobacter sp. ATA002]
MSTPSRALELLWESNEQYIVRSQEEAQDVLAALFRNPELSGRQLHRAQRRIWAEHTYTHRAETIIRAVIPSRERAVETPTVSLLVASMRPHQLEHVFRTAGGFVDVDLELVLVTHGFTVSGSRINELSTKFGVAKVVVIERPFEVTLGECLNAAVAASRGAVLSKMDDDDFYGPYYLRDLLNALHYSGAQLVGKRAHFVKVAAYDATLIRYEGSEHTFTSSIMGPTITGPREIFESNPFLPIGRGEDTKFIRAVRAGGGQVYSADRYNYCQIRGSGDHTWKISDETIIASGDVRLFGPSEEHIVI